jgi:hypothetical protein
MERPASITVFGILNIVFALLGLLGIVVSSVMMFSEAAANNPVVMQMRQNPTYDLWLKITIPLGAVSAIVLLCAGIGLLLFRSWGRTLSLVYAWYAIGFGLLGMLVNYLFLVRPMLEQARQDGGPEATGAFGGAMGGVLGGCIALVYPILLLIFMSNARVKGALQRREVPGVTPGP